MRPGNFLNILFFCFIAPLSAWSQKDAQYIYDGNNLYNSGKIPESSSRFSKALEANPANRKANFNLGNSLYRNGQMVKNGKLSLPPGTNIRPDSMANMIFDQAAQNFAIVANSISDKDTLHQAWHNIGNCYLQKKEYKEAVDAYKKALKYDPKDEETRYNLAYALKNLPKDKSGGGGQQQQQQKNDDKQKKEDQKNSQSEQPKMSKEQAEQLLKALMDSEKKLQEKRRQKQEDASKTTVDKDW
jgi:Ca-activated chloride channel homolog